MKKLFAIVTICLLTTVAANAQQGQGGQGREQMMAAQKQKLVDSLGVTPAVADSVMAIRMSYMMKNRGLRGDGQTPPTDDQKAQMKASNDEMKTKLKAFLTDDQITKLEAMQMRGGGMGGRRGGGNPPPSAPPMQ
jgi:hypothetical protein